MVAATEVNPIQHEFLLIDEGLGTLLHVDERNPGRDWIVPIGRTQARDMQLVGGNRVLISHDNGYTEFDIGSGEIVREVACFEGVTAARRQPDGSTLLAGVNLCGTEGVIVLRLDSDDDVVQTAVFKGDYVRLIRQVSDDTFLMMCNERLRIGNLRGEYVWDAPVQGFLHTWKAVRLQSGSILASAGYGAFLVELSPEGRIVRKFGGKGCVPPEVNPFFYAMFQLMPNSHIVLANWQGHGPGHGYSGVQLLEFDPDGAIVWTWGRPEQISSLQGVLVLDRLDTSRLHDERNGLMEPPCQHAT